MGKERRGWLVQGKTTKHTKPLPQKNKTKKVEYVPALIVQPNVELVHPPLLSAAIEQSSSSSSFPLTLLTCTIE